MTRRDLLLWLERGLLAAGVVLAAWCFAVVWQAHYFESLPVPSPSAAAPLPGDAPPVGTSGADTSENDGHVRAAVEPGSWVARLEAPSVKMSATVLEGTADSILARGAGHIEDTPFPGDAGNVGIAGHRDTTFRPVRNLHVGDPLVITTGDRIFHYRISKTTIVNPEDVYVLDPTDHPTLTLVTCYPFEFVGHAPRRFIVSADLVQEVARTPEGPAGNHTP